MNQNGLRLHFDSILLYKNKSFPSAFQLAVLALEEFSKSFWVEHYYYSAKVNGNFPDRDFEQEWLSLLYFHPRKQKAFFGWGVAFDYSPKFIRMIENGQLEVKKQKATYVGLEKFRRSVDVNSRISLPVKTGAADAKQIISLLNDYLIDQHDMINYYSFHFDISEKDALLTKQLYQQLREWKHRSRLKKTPSFKSRLKKQRK